MKTKDTMALTSWSEYEAGRPEDIEATVALLVDRVVRRTPCCNDDGEDPKPDNEETPDTGALLDAKNYKSKVRAIRTDKDGNTTARRSRHWRPSPSR